MNQWLRRVAMVNSDGKSAPVLADPPGVETVLHELRFRVLARTPYEHLLTELGTLDAAERAFRQGCDVVYVDTFGDYAVDRIRALTSLPVIGAGEASIASVAAQYASFSIVTVWPRSMRYLYEERLAVAQGGERCQGIHHLSGDDELERVGRGDGVKARMNRNESDIIDNLADLCHQAVAQDDSHAILLGCTCMSPVAQALRTRVGVPVLDPSTIGLQAAHRAALESQPSRLTYGAVRNGGLVIDMVDAYLSAQDEESVWIDDCEVCAIFPATVIEEERL